LRARACPQRDRVTAELLTPGQNGALPVAKIHPGIADDALYGGIDLASTLASGRAVRSRGLLADPCALVLTMAERCPVGLGVRLGQWLDQGQGMLVLLDEGAAEDELPPAALTDRLGLFIDMDGTREGAALPAPEPRLIAQARERLAYVSADKTAIKALASAAVDLGIASLRAPLLALACARALAALRGGDSVTQDDLTGAVALIYAQRATQLPEAPEVAPPADEAPQPDDPPPADDGDDAARTPEELRLPEELLLEAVRASLPADLLARLAAGRAARAAKASAGTGAAIKGARRGRPIPSRAGRLDGIARIDPVATLRAAAPWQAMRRALQPDADRLLIRPADLRLRRFQETTDRVLIFAVDASGSAALARLAEAKGAVELLLAQAYARRDHVALIAFRGLAAELLLPPTRSLVQTKRRLAGLPGGGGTPLASGLKMAMELALQSRGRGMSPTLALLTDGRANIALDGQANRPEAMADASRMARILAGSGTPSIVLDTATRPQGALRTLALDMAATYLPLPHADSARLSAALSAAMAA
jgi:magnesium chelatase subunit D